MQKGLTSGTPKASPKPYKMTLLNVFSFLQKIAAYPKTQDRPTPHLADMLRAHNPLPLLSLHLLAFA
jgi:hypothetical protein